MRKLLLVSLVALLLASGAAAADVTAREAEILQLDTLYDALSPEETARLGESSPEKTANFGESMLSILYDTLSGAQSSLRQSIKTGAALLCIALLCAVCHGTELPFADMAATLAGTVGIVLVCTQSFSGMVSLASETIERISGFTALLMPVLASALTASGGLTAGAALYTGSCLFIDLLVRCVKSFLLPLCYAYLALAAAESVAGETQLVRLREMVAWVIGMLLKGIMYVFTGYLALTGLVSGSADAATLKAAKAALSGAVPVVGGIISDASESVLAAASALRSSAGVFGLLAVAAVALSPFIRIALAYLVMKLSGAVAGAFAIPAHGTLLSALTSAMGYLLAMTGSCALMAMISCCCFMRAVSG